MKLLLTTDTVGGVWTYALELARALVPHDVCVALATMGAPLTPAQRREADAVPGLQVYESQYKLEWMSDPWSDVRDAGEWLLSLEDRIRPRVVHLNGFAHAALPWRAPTLVVAHSCVLTWWRAVKGCEAPAASWDEYRRQVARGLRAADIVAAPSAAMLSALLGAYGSLPRTRVIHNGRSASSFAPGQKEPFILSAGRLWDEAKNVQTLADIAPQLPWPVYVAGEQQHPSRDRDNSLAQENVKLLGRLSLNEMAPLYSRASIYALPARYEPFGLTAVEAALAGCALVLGDIPSLREVWDNAASFVPPNDSDALAAAIQALIDDPDRRTQLAAAARQRAARYTPERMAMSYLDVYRELSEPGPAVESVMVGVGGDAGSWDML